MESHPLLSDDPTAVNEWCTATLKAFADARPFPSYEALVDTTAHEYTRETHNAVERIYASGFDDPLSYRLGAEIKARGGSDALVAACQVVHAFAQSAVAHAVEEGDAMVACPLARHEICMMAHSLHYQWMCNVA